MSIWFQMNRFLLFSVISAVDMLYVYYATMVIIKNRINKIIRNVKTQNAE